MDRREMKVIGTAPPDPELDAKLEAMEEQAEADLLAGRVGFTWSPSSKETAASRRAPIAWVVAAVLTAAALVLRNLVRHAAARH